MRTLRTPALLAVAGTLLLAGCTGGTAALSASDDTTPTTDPPSASAAPMPTEVPAADGLVRTRDLALVMDRGDGPSELCVGAVAESYPPQCGGPPIEGWDWSAEQRFHERVGSVRWGSFAVTGRWDGEVLAVVDAVPAALYSPIVTPDTPPPAPAVEHSEAELAAIVEELSAGFPGVQVVHTDDQNHVFVDVTYDDGSLQAWADRRYGEDVVLVTSAFVDVAG